MATNKEELDVISAKGADFWMSDLNQKSQNKNTHFYLYVNAVTVEERPNSDENPSPILKADICTLSNSTSTVHNGESITQTQGSTKSPPHLETKYKRPPPRPPTLGSGSGMGLLFSSTSSAQTLAPVAPEPERTERVGEEGEEEKTTTLISPPVLKPPIPPQNRSAPPVPPAPVRRNLSSKSSGRESDVEKAADPEGSEQQLEEDGKEKEKKGKEKENETTGSQCPPPVRKPSRPVPPPRTKPAFPNTALHNNRAVGGTTNQKSGKKETPLSPGRRPDVSLYSPQGGAVLGTDPDSCSTSSTEEDGEANHEPEQNSRIVESRSPKAEVKRTPTNAMLDRARSRLSTVLAGLISHERRLTRRIVELARDPSSYFGNLVKEHQAFTLETMSNHSTSTELLQEIRQMMTQLKSYLLQSSELQAMIEPQHQYTQDKLESLVEAALCKSVLKPLREPIYQNLEKVHGDDNSLKQLAEKQSVVLGSTTTSLGITTAIPEASAMEKISIKLNNLHQEYSPQKKIELLLKTCKIIYDCMSVSSPGRAHGADDFLPVMMYVLARCNLAALQLDVEYMMELMDPSLTLGEGSYYLTTTYGALEHIKTFDLKGSASRQLSREVQDSIHRWERRRTLNQECVAQGSVRDFLTVCCPEMGSDPKTLGVLPNTTIQQLTEQCAARFEQDSYTLSVYMDGVEQSLAPTELALAVKKRCHPGSYCFIFHPEGQPIPPAARSCPSVPPPPAPPPVGSILPLDTAQLGEEESLISL
ncbi:ras and Rab interactor 3-like [Gouania willdenowi]|uniref:ras and Rab interactor 3-like n=1 Tax=Gouania willdenowi TaxID=441366 RepID=UPI001054AACC|nr:ras and Rab interactor 3-like [Gouania willdenowi]